MRKEDRRNEIRKSIEEHESDLKKAKENLNGLTGSERRAEVEYCNLISRIIANLEAELEGLES